MFGFVTPPHKLEAHSQEADLVCLYCANTLTLALARLTVAIPHIQTRLPVQVQLTRRLIQDFVTYLIGAIQIHEKPS